jgi:sulfur-oxidizing protein SoxY
MTPPQRVGAQIVSSATALSRRRILACGLGLAGALVQVRPARATPEAMAAAIHRFTGGAAWHEGKVKLDVAALVDNGNTVPVTVSVAHVPANEVTAIALFNERNPQSEVARFDFGPRAASRTVATRIRLATSQQLVAVARLSDGNCWSHSVEVVVVLAACIE